MSVAGRAAARRLQACILAALSLLVLPGAARAEWLEASSPNFVIHADASESSITRYSQELERYHAAMALVTGQQAIVPSPSNRVTVYVVSSVSEVRRILGDKSGHVAGVYFPRAGGSLAITPRVTGGGRDIDFSKFVLLHEYAHHFMIGSSVFPMPRWYSEGGAEFFASAKFEANGDVWLGRANEFRAGEIFLAKDVTATNCSIPQPTGHRQAGDTMPITARAGRCFTICRWIRRTGMGKWRDTFDNWSKARVCERPPWPLSAIWKNSTRTLIAISRARGSARSRFRQTA